MAAGGKFGLTSEWLGCSGGAFRDLLAHRPLGDVVVARLDQDRLELALEAGRLGTWVWDMASGTTTWDVRLEELHGLPPGGFGGTFDDWLASLYPDDRAECLARVERALNDPGSYVLLHRTQWPDGSLHWIECRGRVTVDDCGAPTGTVGVAFDVTRARRNPPSDRSRAGKRSPARALDAASAPPPPPSPGAGGDPRRPLHGRAGRGYRR